VDQSSGEEIQQTGAGLTAVDNLRANLHRVDLQMLRGDPYHDTFLNLDG
jgi:hypothetical protein